MARLRELLAAGLRWLAEVLDPTPEFDPFVSPESLERLEMIDWSKAVANALNPYFIREGYLDITEPGEFGEAQQP